MTREPRTPRRAWKVATLALVSALVATSTSAAVRRLREHPASTAQAGVQRAWRLLRDDATRASRATLVHEARRYKQAQIPSRHDWAQVDVPLSWLGGRSPGRSAQWNAARALWEGDEPLHHAAALWLRQGDPCGTFEILLARSSPFMTAEVATIPASFSRGWAVDEAPCPMPEELTEQLRSLLVPGDPPVLGPYGQGVILTRMWGREQEIHRYLDHARRGRLPTIWSAWAFERFEPLGVRLDSFLVLERTNVVALAVLDDAAGLQRTIATLNEGPLPTAECRLTRCDAATRQVVAAAEILLGRGSREHLHALLRDQYAYIRRPRPPEPPM